MTIHIINSRRISTEFVYPPIPDRRWDWSAVDDDTYDGAPDTKWPCNCVGYGPTEQEAIADLMIQLEDGDVMIELVEP